MNDASHGKTRFRVGGMDCASCATKIENAVSRLPGITEVGISVSAGTMIVTHQGAVPSAAISKQVKALGYSVAEVGAARTAAPTAHVHEHGPNCSHDHAGHHHASHDHAGHDHGDHSGHDHGAATASVAGAGHDHFDLDDGPWWKSRKAKLTIACGAALVAAYAIGQLLPQIGHWAFLAALAVGLVPVARRAYAGAISGTPFSIETLMTIAAVGAVFIGATEEATMVVLLFLIGELLEGVAARRARASIRGLADLVPKTALVEESGATREIAADALQVGAIMLVRPGDRVAADGVIIDGSSTLDEAPVTGESVPKSKTTGDDVFAGTINTDAVLRVRVTAAAADNTIARVIKLVEEAQESKAPTERFIDRFSRYYTPAVLVVGALVAILPPLVAGGSWEEWIYKGLAILLIGCPCALVISTPAAIAAGLSAGARRGLLLKGGAVFEGMRRVTMVALDKTGTLTEGKPKVTDIIGVGHSETKVLSLAAALETGSSHPLALAILGRAKVDGVPIPPANAAKAIAGKGVTANVGGEEVFLASPGAAEEMAGLSAEQNARIAAFNADGKTVSVLLVDGKVAGILAMRDEPRADAIAALARLKDDGIATVMLTGDNETTAKAIGKGLGINVRAGLMPDDKQRIVRELQKQGQIVAKVGDGINDAPALAAADFGVAMGGGTDVALETADAAILHGRVSDIPDMIALSKSVMGNIAQNITIALGLKAVFLVTTIMGITGLWPAILADTGATVLVTANAMRLLAWRGR
ncbi:Cd2+/Zn2+-exporting ATPase [Aminobacter aminovorans]|uniref:P-type Zn(2+) transporter n=1 Tax=Aminobacter aminovorans TaxID=83263 RepID=A0A380WL21_AMIAI|nr:heavy metal translocating P-type ATPase [Aminobacter aminovorans]TCS28153.1 Cd2+/Zn2+-exporting ATPase [Aminobacter aminovorans]SUU89435.1 Lead, cadmium, zinc and mercury-transporting ATPase [Aminobacter aminovorans]